MSTTNFPTTAIELDANSRPGVAGHFPGNVGPYNLQVGTPVQDANGIWYAPLISQLGANSAGVSLVNSANTGIPSAIPTIVQKKAAASTGSVASLAATFTNANAAGNTIVVVAGCGNGTAMTVADSAGNTYTQAVTEPNSTTFEAAIFYSTGALNNGIVTSAANTVTVTNAGSTASMAVEIYEVSGLLTQAVAQPDYTSVGTGSSAAPSIPNHAPSLPNSIAFLGVAVGTAAQAVTAVAGSGWTLDSSQNTTTPAGLFSFGSLSAFLASTAPVTPKATLAGSEPWAAAAAVFKPVALPVMGIVTQDGYNYTHFNTAQTNTVVKNGPGILHALILNTAIASATFEYDDAITHANAMGIFTLPATLLASNGYYELDVRFNTGLAITSTGTADWTVVWK